MTRRDFLRFISIFFFIPLLKFSETLKYENFSSKRYDYDFTPRKKGKIFKHLPKSLETVKHWGILPLTEVYEKREFI